jgi:urease accessory protein
VRGTQNLLKEFFSRFKAESIKSVFTQVNSKQVFISILVIWVLLGIFSPASAHHAIAGRTPANLFEGLLSGFAHPIIGLDHFLGVIATGLIAVGQTLGILLPISFVLTTLAGTGIHLLGWNLPIPEIMIALSVIIFGGILILKQNTFKIPQLQQLAFVSITAIAGVFHGYAYGESIIGAEMTPLFAYLIGFTLIQLVIALSSYKIGSVIFEQFRQQFFKIIPLMGLAISTVGVVFLLS